MSERFLLIPFGPDVLALSREEFDAAKQRAREAGFGGGVALPPAQEDWLDVAGAAKRLGVSEAFIYDRTRTKQIPFHAVGRLLRFKPSELDAWAAGRNGQHSGQRKMRSYDGVK